MNCHGKSVATKFLLIIAASFLFATSLIAQTSNNQPAGPLMTRTTTRHENYKLQVGGTLTLIGAPAGSIVIEGWQKSEIDISATIELQGPNAAALDQLAVVNNFGVDVDVNHIRILTTGTHDRAFMKRVAKNFPKALIGLPWKIDYVIKLPALTDVEVDGGIGPINLSGVEGTLRLNALKSDAKLSLTGGLASVVVQSGSIDVTVPVRSWHGLGAEVSLASGNLNVGLMAALSADINADVLRLGEIKNTFPDLQLRDRANQRSLRARAGSGGATLSFTVGDGTIAIKQISAQ